MRALFNKFAGLGARTDRKDSAAVREKPSLGKLPEWPPASAAPASAPPIAASASHDSRITADAPEEAAGESPKGSGARRTAKERDEAPKKVAFISPPPTPVGLAAVRPLPSVADEDEAPEASAPPAPAPSSAREARGSTSTAATASRTDVGSSRATPKPASTRGAPSPHPGRSFTDAASIQQSLRSGTPYSTRSAATTATVSQPASWSEGAEGDLVSNLGARERTRQEVLWEIVASEERYVAELVKMRDTFILPLLHPYAASPLGSPLPGDYAEPDYTRFDSPAPSLEHLPIASRFLSPTPSARTGKDTPAGDSSDDEPEPTPPARNAKHPRSPYRAGTATGTRAPIVPFPSRSHHSLPPPPRAPPPNASSTSLGRTSFVGAPAPAARSGLLRKSKRSLTGNGGSGIIPNGGVAPHTLPDDLRVCLEAVEARILEGHLKLSDGLRKRYEDQYPLVRSLADVFVANSHILRGYADYVLHLERALDQVQDALTSAAGASSKTKSKRPDADEWAKVCAVLRRLEHDASDKGETGLAISLSKPFQRLLKYPLLFQNLLFHTDPSTFEYESTLQMVAEVETIVRSIEDDKIQKEERDRTRDVLARVDGLDRVRQLAAPKPSRVLLDEKPLEAPGGPPSASAGAATAANNANGKAVKGKSSLRRFSDALGSGGGKKDLWLVVFNDVTLRCQRTGTTVLPLGSASAAGGSGGASTRTTSMPELQGKARGGAAGAGGRRGAAARPRNLYRFVKVESWSIGGAAAPREGVVSMDEVRTRQQAHLSVQPRIVPMPEEDEDAGGVDSDDSDRKSKMSFSYWGADKVTLQKPLVKPGAVPGRQTPLGSTAAPAAAGAAGRDRGVRGAGAATGYSRESSANAKFGTRLVSGDGPAAAAARPGSRATATRTPVVRAGARSDDGHGSRVTVTRPEWNGSTRGGAAAAAGAKRARNTSGPSSAAVVSTKTKVLGSPAPSEDSGIGLYRKYQAAEHA